MADHLSREYLTDVDTMGRRIRQAMDADAPWNARTRAAAFESVMSNAIIEGPRFRQACVDAMAMGYAEPTECWSDMEETQRTPTMHLCFMMPDYARVAPIPSRERVRGNMSAVSRPIDHAAAAAAAEAEAAARLAHERKYRDIHDYLCLVGLLPAPFQGEHHRITIKDVLIRTIERMRPLVSPVICSPMDLAELARRMGKAEAGDVITVVFSGHGDRSPLEAHSRIGRFLLERKEILTEAWLRSTLRAQKFAGTLILLAATCHASDDRTPVAANEAVVAQAPSADVSYPPACRVVRVTSSARDEKTFVKDVPLFAEFVRVLFTERPTYEALLRPDGRCVRDVWDKARRAVLRSSEVALPPPLVSGDARTARSAAPFGTPADDDSQ